jgi:hypothetical protein
MSLEAKIESILESIEKSWRITIEYLWDEDMLKYWISFSDNPTFDQYFNTLPEFVIFLNGFLTALTIK